MRTAKWFDDLTVLGNMAPAQAAAKLQELGEEELARVLDDQSPVYTRGASAKRAWRDLWPFRDKAWQHTAHTFGYLPPAPPDSGPLPLRHAGNIAPDLTLKNSRVKITLDCLRVADYPGRGMHRVLLDFYAQNQRPDNVEHLHFNATYRVRENEHAAVLGYPIFTGLYVGQDSIAFKCFTVNVKNEGDGSFLDLFESDVFRYGLQLTAAVQPAVALFSEVAFGLTRALASRTKNVPVQDFHLGLDFTNIATRARLAEGSYIAVQIPESMQTAWNWQEWIYQPANGRIVSANQPEQLIPYNYLVFSVSRYEGE